MNKSYLLALFRPSVDFRGSSEGNASIPPYVEPRLRGDNKASDFSQELFTFENRNLNATEILAAYEERRRQVGRRQSMHKAFDVHTDSLDRFFN